MLKFTGKAGEHKEVPKQYLVGSEEKAYCTYAWIETDELNIEDQIPIAVLDYKPKYSRRTQFVLEDPIWNWIEEERTSEIQLWISKNIDRINEEFKSFMGFN